MSWQALVMAELPVSFGERSRIPGEMWRAGRRFCFSERYLGAGGGLDCRSPDWIA